MAVLQLAACLGPPPAHAPQDGCGEHHAHAAFARSASAPPGLPQGSLARPEPAWVRAPGLCLNPVSCMFCLPAPLHSNHCQL
jgi:hypothetical protein